MHKVSPHILFHHSWRSVAPLDFNSWSVDSLLMEAFSGVTGASPPITPGKQRLGVYLRGVWGLELLAPDLEVSLDLRDGLGV